MRVSWLLFVVVSVCSILVCLANAQDGSGSYLHHICSNYTSNSIYQTNLNTLLSSLSSDTNIDYGFYNISEGEGIERVNSITLCRGDLSLTACRKCVNFSTIDHPKRCPNQKEAIVWYDNCMFKYSNKSIFYSIEDIPFYMWNINNVSNVSTFTETLDGFLSSLRKNASSGDSRQKFAIGNTKYVDFTTIYGLMQCTPDLTVLQCNNCLENSFRQVVKYPGSEGGRVFGGSCNFRYQFYQFYETPSPPTSPLPPAIAPSSRTTTIVPPTGGGSNKVRNIIISVVSAVCFVILIVCIYVFLRLRKQRNKLDSVDEIGAETLQLDFGIVRAAANNFSIDNKLVQGGFGSVYKTDTK